MSPLGTKLGILSLSGAAAGGYNPAMAAQWYGFLENPNAKYSENEL